MPIVNRERIAPLLKHPIHPILTDFPIVLWSLVLVWDVAALWLGSPWWRVGFWTLLLGLAAAVAAALTGLLDSRKVGQEDPAQRTVNAHLLLMSTALTIFIGSAIVRGGSGDLDGLRAAGALACTLAGLATMLAGAWFGGELVFHHGLGVQTAVTRSSAVPAHAASILDSEGPHGNRASPN